MLDGIEFVKLLFGDEVGIDCLHDVHDEALVFSLNLLTSTLRGRFFSTTDMLLVYVLANREGEARPSCLLRVHEWRERKLALVSRGCIAN